MCKNELVQESYDVFPGGAAKLYTWSISEAFALHTFQSKHREYRFSLPISLLYLGGV